MSSVPDGAWRTSRWLRLYDWDWGRHPYPGIDPRSAARRAETYPRKFFYHVLRFRPPHLDISDVTGAVEYNEALHELLVHYQTLVPFAPLMADDVADRYGGAAVVAEVVNGLIQRGMLVPEDAEEPIDTRAVVSASDTLYVTIQVPEEFAAALDVVGRAQPRTVVEIGTACGGTLFGWAQVAHPEARLISMDLTGGVGGGGYMPHHEPHFRSFCAPGQHLTCILGDSTRPDIIKRVDTALGGSAVDVLFIDGDHSYEGVSKDFANYRRLVRDGGLILFHDIQPPDPDGAQPMGVWRFWREIKAEYRHTEIIHDPKQHSAGIGILHV